MSTIDLASQPEVLSSPNPVFVELSPRRTVAESASTLGRVSCSSCSAACCSEGVVLPLTEREATQLRDAGTVLEEYKPTDAVRRGFHLKRFREGRKTYQLGSPCGNLVEADDGSKKCGDYSRRPTACRSLPVGGYHCHKIRVETGQEPRKVFDDFLRATAS